MADDRTAKVASGAAVPSGPATPRPIVIDADMDHSDLAAILVLLRDPAVEVLGIAIDGTGLVHCQGGRLVTRYLLDELGVTDVPFGCGRQNGGEDSRLVENIARIRAVSDVPVCVGFGVSTPEQAAYIGQHADGVVVGSALVWP